MDLRYGMTGGRRFLCHLFLALVAVTMTVQAACGQARCVGYYPMWMRTTLPANNVRFDYVTHINHAFAWPNTDGTIASDDGASVDTAIINAAHRAGRRILLSFGGAGATQTANFALVAADTALRRKFVSNVVARLSLYHYDGADLDWEGPANAADRSNEVALVQQMRAAFRAVDTTWLITMAVGISDWSGQWEDFASLRLSIDWFNAMCYDIYGSWSSVAGHNAPMVEPPAYTGNWSVTQGITYLHVTRGIPSAQLTLGLPFFGQRFHFTRPGGLYSSFTSAAEVLYTDVANDLASGWAYSWDTLSQVPYCQDAGRLTLDTFDDSASITIKCDYAKTSGLAGVMIWALGEDLWAGGQPLMSAVGRAMSPATGVLAQYAPPAAGAFTLYGNYPNPFNPTTTLRYALAHRSFVSVTVYNALGQEIATLVSGVEEAGIHEVRFDGGGHASGMYICRIRADGLAQSKAMMLVK